MHERIPGMVAGLYHDIDDSYTLSELDKAYICIMYPRPEIRLIPRHQNGCSSMRWPCVVSVAKMLKLHRVF